VLPFFIKKNCRQCSILKFLIVSVGVRTLSFHNFRDDCLVKHVLHCWFCIRLTNCLAENVPVIPGRFVYTIQVVFLINTFFFHYFI